jgi:hypothetical protein
MSDTPRTDGAANESIVCVYETSKQLERELAEAIAQRDELLKTADAWFEAWNSGYDEDFHEAKEMEKLIIKLKGKSHE